MINYSVNYTINETEVRPINPSKAFYETLEEAQSVFNKAEVGQTGLSKNEIERYHIELTLEKNEWDGEDYDTGTVLESRYF